MHAARKDTTTPANAVPSHHAEGGFRNPYNRESRGFRDFLRWQLGRGPDEMPVVPDSRIPPYVPHTVTPDLNKIHHPDASAIQITWIGHATFLIQLRGINILTDPVFSERCSPFSFLGPKRAAPPGIAINQLPPIDLVLLSHDHYDHLDGKTIRRLGDKPRYVVPLGLKAWLARRDIRDVEELDWWQTTPFGGLQLQGVPAQHFSGRGPFGRNKTLWCGWVIQADQTKLHFVGDSGYAPYFQEIARRVGPIDVAFIPIGAYRPRWFMGPMHVDPSEAVKIHRELGARRSIGMHWGTFQLSDEPMGAPRVELHQALEAAGITDDAFTTMAFGETRIYC